LLAQKNYRALLHGAKLARDITCKMWTDRGQKLRQIEGLGFQYAKFLGDAGISTFEALLNTSAGKIEMVGINLTQLTGRNPPFGNNILAKCNEIPFVGMQVEEVRAVSRAFIEKPEFHVKMYLKNKAPAVPSKAPHFIQPTFLFIAGTSHGQLIEARRFSQSNLSFDHELKVSFEPVDVNEKVIFTLICNDFVGLDVEKAIAPKISERMVKNIDESKRILNSKYFENEKTTMDAQLDIWDGIDDSVIETINEPIAPELKIDNLESCKHLCKDKDNCRHLCCKTGVPKNRRIRGRKVENKPEQDSTKKLREKAVMHTISSFENDLQLNSGMLDDSIFDSLSDCTTVLKDYKREQPDTIKNSPAKMEDVENKESKQSYLNQIQSMSEWPRDVDAPEILSISSNEFPETFSHDSFLDILNQDDLPPPLPSECVSSTILVAENDEILMDDSSSEDNRSIPEIFDEDEKTALKNLMADFL
jgi:ATP-dependent DNA helicase HFM1/MER3